MEPTRTDFVLTLVEWERTRQDRLLVEGAIPFNVASVTEDDGAKLSVLIEEVGEVARVLNDAGDPADLGGYVESLKPLQEELIQVAAVAVGWAEAVVQMRRELGS